MPNVLVLANETIGGARLLDAVRDRAARGDDVRFHIVVPLDGTTTMGVSARFADAAGALFVSLAPDRLTPGSSSTSPRCTTSTAPASTSWSS